MAGRTLTITFLGDAKSATKAMGDVEAAGGSLQAKIGGLSGAFSGVATAAAGFLSANVIAKAPGFLIGAAQGAAEDAAATARLEQALRNAGGSFDDNLAKVNARIDAGQRLAYGDDAVRDSFQSLLAATGDVDEALRRQKVAMDLSRGAGISLEQASRMVGKVNSENVEAFKRLGITIGDNATEAEALAAVQAKYAGQSGTYAKSTAGQFEQAKIAVSEIVEGLGAALLPVMARLGTALANNLPRIQAFVGALGEKAAASIGPAMGQIMRVVQQVVAYFVNTVVPVLGDIWSKDVAPKLAVARDLFGELAEKVGVLASAVADKLKGPLTDVLEFIGSHKEILAAAAIVIGGVLVAAFTAWAVAAASAAAATLLAIAPVIAIGVALTALVAIVLLVIKNWDDLVRKFPVLRTIADGVKTALAAFTTWVTGTFVPKTLEIYNGVKDAVDKSAQFVKDHWDEIRAVIEPAIKALVIIVQTQWAAIETAIKTAWGLIKGFIDVAVGLLTGDWDRAWKGIKEMATAAFDGVLSYLKLTWAGVKALITGPFADLLEPAEGAFGLKKAIVGAFGAISTGISTAMGGLWSAVASAVNPIIDAYNNSLGRVPGAPNIPRFGGGGGSGGDSSGFGAPVPGGDDDQMPGREIFGQTAGGAGGGGGGAYIDPRGVTLTANDIYALKQAPDFGFVGARPGVVINLPNASIRNEDEARIHITRAARAAGLS